MKVKKTQPTGSQVHVAVPMGSRKDRMLKSRAHPQIAELKESLLKLTGLLEKFFTEEGEEEVGKQEAVRRVAKLAVLHDGKMLMGLRRDNRKWTLPGGHVEPAETMLQGAMRELWEETGIEIKPTQILPLTEEVELEDRAGKPLFVKGFVVRLDDRPSTSISGDPDDEVLRWKWVDITDGLPDAVYENLHVPPERCTVLQALNIVFEDVEKEEAVDVDSDPDMFPGIDNLEAGLLKAALDEGWMRKETSGYPLQIFHPDDSNESATLDMQQIVEGMDWETANGTKDAETARLDTVANLETDGDHYRKLREQSDGTDDVLAKDTEQTEESPFAGEGYNIDIGSGTEREPGHIGLDTYPYDYGTMVHDVTMGLPFADESVSSVRLVNSLHEMDGLSDDPKPLLSEIHRVMMPGGQFVYEGPNEIYNEPEWTSDYPGFVLTHQEDTGSLRDAVGKADDGPVRHVFTRVAVPDPATANDAEPRVGVSQFDDLPADALNAADAMSYYWSDSTSSGRGNMLHGYPSQGAMAKDGSAGDDGNSQTLVEQLVAEALEPKQINPAAPGKPTAGVSKIGGKIGKKVEKILRSGRVVPILKANQHRQIVYGVILAPDEIDAQEDFMTADEIELAAHRYLVKSRVVGSGHEKPVDAIPVESFIAPVDFQMDGQYGPQTVTKGSWVLGVYIKDAAEWDKVVNGDYTGFSVGGVGARQTT